MDTGGTVSVLRLDAAGGILKISLFTRLLCKELVLLSVDTQGLYVDSQYSRQVAALFVRSQVAGVALFLLQL